MPNNAKIMFLHNSTGLGVYQGGVDAWFKNYNSTNAKSYELTEKWAPSANQPRNYWHGWVDAPGTEEGLQSLDVLTAEYHVIVFKHCFPVSYIDYGDIASAPAPDITSTTKSSANYRLWYEALKRKMHEYPNTRFLVWTPPAVFEGPPNPSIDAATTAKNFSEWIRDTWDEPGDNIFVWDFRTLETKGTGLFLANEYSKDPAANESHPSESFNRLVAPLFSRRVVDVIEGRADNTSVTGE